MNSSTDNPQQSAGAADPAATAKPPRLSLGLWESYTLPNGDLAVMIVLPESFASALQAQAENLGLPFADYLRGWVQRAADYGWL